MEKEKEILRKGSWVFSEDENLLHTEPSRWFRADSGSHLLNHEHQFLKHSGFWKTSIPAQSPTMLNLEDFRQNSLCPRYWFEQDRSAEWREQGLTCDRATHVLSGCKSIPITSGYFRHLRCHSTWDSLCKPLCFPERKLTFYKLIFFPTEHEKRRKSIFLGYDNTRIPQLANASLKFQRKALIPSLLRATLYPLNSIYKLKLFASYKKPAIILKVLCGIWNVIFRKGKHVISLLKRLCLKADKNSPVYLQILKPESSFNRKPQQKQL